MSLQYPYTDVLQGTRTRELYRLVLFADRLSARNDLPGVVLHVCHGQRPNSSTYERILAAGKLTRPRTAYVLQTCILNRFDMLITCCVCATDIHARSMMQVGLWLRSDDKRDIRNDRVRECHSKYGDRLFLLRSILAKI